MDFNFNGANGSCSNDNTLAALPLLSQLQQQYQALVKGYGQGQNNSSFSTEQHHSLFHLPQFQNSGLAVAVPSFDPAAVMASNNNSSQNGNNSQDYLMGEDDKDDLKDDLGLDGDLDRNGQHHPIAEFLYQLTKMLTDDNSEIIEWADGRIKVHYPERLEGEVLHKYFRHSKFASFQRQLNYFGFRKIAGKGKMSPCSYVNDAATSDIRSLLLIKRKTNGSAARKAAMQQRAVALANNALNPLLNFPGAAAALAGNPAALASLANPQALSGAMALLSDNALRAGLLAQHAGLSGAGNSPQLNLLLQQQQQLQQAHANSLFGLNVGLNAKLDDNNGMGGFPAPAPQPPQQQLQNSNNGIQHVDHSQIAQQTHQLQQLQQQLQQLQQQHRQQQQQQQQQQYQLQQQNKVPGSSLQPSPQLGGASAALNSLNNGSNFSSFQKDAGDATKAATTASSQFEQFLAARLAAASGSQSSNPFGSLGAASAALKQLQGGNDNPASAALQQQFSSMPASAAAASAAADQSQASNSLFESALNLKSLLQEHQAAATAQEAQQNAAHAAQARGLMNRLPSSNTIFPSVASFGNLLNSSNRLSSLLSLSSFVGGPGNGAPVSSREPSLADLAAAIHPGNVGSSAPLSAAFAAFQQQHNSASAAANQFRIDN